MATESYYSPWTNLLPVHCKSRSKTNEIPIHRVGCISFLSYAWLDKLMWKLFRQQNTEVDVATVWSCPATEQAALNADRLERLWENELSTCGGISNASIRRVFLRFVRRRCLAAVVLLIVSLGLLTFTVVFIVSSILSLTVSQDRESHDLWKGLLLVAGLFLTNILSSLLFLGSNTIGHIAAGRLRAGALCLLYRKLLKTTSLQDETIGKVVNLFTNDGQRIFDGVSMISNLLAGPILVIGATIYAICLLGAWALIGFSILILLLPLQMFVGKTFMLFRSKAIVITDKRVRLMNEYLSSIRFIKVNSMEIPLSKIISTVRSCEQQLLEKVNICMSLAVMSPSLLTSIATIITLVAYTSAGHQLSGLQGFMYLLIYSSIQDKLEFTMLSMKMVSEMFVAASRFQEVFILDKMNQSIIGEERFKTDQNGSNSIEAKELQISWPNKRHSTKPYSQTSENGLKEIVKPAPAKNLNNGEELILMLSDDGDSAVQTPMKETASFTFTILQNSLIGVAGPVGSGKTALIKALLGQMNLDSGELKVNGTIAYVPQQPWIFHGTIRENIVLNIDYDKTRYDAVLAASCLKPDLDLMPEGDMTIVGERGVTLSGGQKNRINLARAAYSQRDIYLLDDPFSSLDSDVAGSVFRRLVRSFLKGKIIIMVTHLVKFLKECDEVIYLPGGKQTAERGSHDELLSREGTYATFVNIGNQKSMKNYVEHEGTNPDLIKSVEPVPDTKQNDQPSRFFCDKSLIDEEQSLIGANGAKKRSESLAVCGSEQYEGSVSHCTYTTYISAAGGLLAALGVVIASLAAEGIRAFSYWWLAYWLEQAKTDTITATGNNQTTVGNITSNESNSWVYELVYGLSLVGIIVFFTLRCVIIAKVLMRASSRLHDQMFNRMMKAPVFFFDTTPLGRIINRFSRDIDEMDTRLPMLIDNTMRALLNILIYITLIALIMPWFLVVLPLAIIAFVLLYTVFRAGIRVLQRRQLSSLSPLLAHVDATVRGLSSIHAYQQNGDFSERFTEILNRNTTCVLLYQFAFRWANVHLSLLTTTLLSVAALIIFLLRHVIPTAYAGATFIYAFQLLTLFQFFVRFAVDTEATFSSTERVRSYSTKLPQEGSKKAPAVELPSNWPASGQIEFKRFQLRYSIVSPLVLDDVTFTVKPAEKIGIVGRTGSGKTSLVSALFRLTEKCGGSIHIDGIDISSLRLEKVRSVLSMIPQDPVLFTGTIRSNMDPFNVHTDPELWQALDKCHMKDAVTSLEGQLAYPVSQNGEHLSQGERQLLCMSRVLLRHSRIVILDEATASLDPDMARRIQDTVSDSFAQCTTLIIAHSMKTIVNCDRVLVLDAGKVVEFDEPRVLISHPSSAFNRLVTSSDLYGDESNRSVA